MQKGTYQRTPETREKLRQATLKQWANPEHREKIRLALIGNKYTLGMKHSSETREKIRQARLGRKASPETREKVRQAALKRCADPDYREGLRQRRLRQVFPSKMTSIERLLHTEFKKRRLKFEMHKTMFGRFQPDFVFAQAHLIVQADGDYWHSRPDRRTQDVTFDKAATAEGWSVWRFGEQEIKMHAHICAKAVARFVRCYR